MSRRDEINSNDPDLMRILDGDSDFRFPSVMNIEEAIEEADSGNQAVILIRRVAKNGSVEYSVIGDDDVEVDPDLHVVIFHTREV